MATKKATKKSATKKSATKKAAAKKSATKKSATKKSATTKVSGKKVTREEVCKQEVFREKVRTQVQLRSRQAGQDRDARDASGQAEEWSQRKESDQSQAGHRHRFIGSSQEGREGSTESECVIKTMGGCIAAAAQS
jgi:hypothetical protein